MSTRGWRKHSDYDPAHFGKAVRDARMALRLHEPRRSKKWTLEYVASKSSIGNKGSLSQIEAGKRSLDAQTRHSLVRLLSDGLKASPMEISRRDLLIAGLASVITGTVSAPRIITASAKAVAAMDVLLASADSRLEEWNLLLYMGESERVLGNAGDFYQDLVRRLPWIHEDPIALVTTVRVGLTKARAEELSLPWRLACRTAANTYTNLERQLFTPTLDRVRGQARFLPYVGEYAKLLDARARMLRRIGHFRRSIQDLRQALNLAHEAEDRVQEIDAHFKLTHTLACLGLERQSQAQLLEAQKAIEGLPARDQAQHEIFLQYYSGERFKRLAYNPYVDLPREKRQQYAERGFRDLTNAARMIGNHWLEHEATHHIVGFHPLYTRMSQLQCLAWEDQRKTYEDLLSLRDEAEKSFPALIAKIDLTLSCVDEIKAWRSHNPLLGFDLDTGLDAGTERFPSDASAVRAILLKAP